MSPDGRIAADRIWKRFRTDRQARSIRDRLELGRKSRGWRWALRDVDLQVEAGDSIALVGANGSGKSTLLKILTGVMDPYAGRLEVTGRIGALIEVRSGIHHQLTGRQNIYVYGALIGMTRREVAGRFDEIVAFAELDAAIDRPVKFYSTGMQMRLGFAVAAFLDPEVMLVDEVLAVGDAWFQQRCLDKLRDILAGGCTLVFVSHDLAAVEASCRRAILLEDGIKVADGLVHDVLEQYRFGVEERSMIALDHEGPVRVTRAATVPDGGRAATDGPVTIEVAIESDIQRAVVVCLGVSEGTASPVIALRHDLYLSTGATTVHCELERLPLPRGRFAIWFGVFTPTGEDVLAWQPVTNLDVYGPDLDTAPSGVLRLAPVHVNASWSEP